MSLVMIRRLAACLAFGACAASSFAQTTVGGVIDTDTTWTAVGNPYRVVDDIVVTGGATLTIERGVRVDFGSNTGMLIGPSTSAGSGQLIITGGPGASYAQLVGGTGLEFGPRAVPATLDPSTGAYLSGSRLLYCSLSQVMSGYAIQTRATVPHLDQVVITRTSAASGVLVDLAGQPEASVRWGTLTLGEVRGNGLVIRGGRAHRIASLSAFDMISVGTATAIVHVDIAQAAGPDGYDLWIEGGDILDAPHDEVFVLPSSSSRATRRYRFDDMTFERCPGTTLPLERDTIIELNNCRFESCARPVFGRGTRNTLRASDTEFMSGGSVVGGLLELVRCTFEGNTAPAISSSFGVFIRESTLVGNSGNGLGGAIEAAFLDAFDCHFERNSALRGGAIWTLSLASAGNTYVANSAELGGAIYLRSRRSLVGQPGRPDVFVGNTAAQDGGAVYIDGTLDELVSVELRRNTATRGGGVFVSAASGGLSISQPGGTGTVIQGNVADIGEDVYVQALAGTVDILAPCVDWGTRDADEIADRIFDGDDDAALARVDFQPIGPCDCRADIDGDGRLTIFDFLAFQTAFDAGDLETADFDGDGRLTLFDFLAFQTAFNAGC